jgi:molybdopterin biosynthesis enzyme MoaB
VAVPGSPSAARDTVNALFPALFHAFPIMKGGGHG